MLKTEEDGARIKPAGMIMSYTAHQLVEMAKCEADPIYFIENYVYIQHPTKGRMKFTLFPFQRDLINVYNESNRVIAMLSRQCGKALSLDTPIPTPSGWTTMGQIKVGDHILGDDGKPARVSFATDIMYDHDVYDVEFDNGEIIKSDAEHIWRVSSNVYKSGEVVDVTTEELIPIVNKAHDQGQSVRIACTKPLELDELELPIDPYTLGVWLGDDNSNDARFHGHVDDVDEIIKNISESAHTVGESKRDGRNKNVVRQKIDGLYSLLREHKLLGNKHIPDQYLRSSKEQRLELLRGLMDTDGHARPRGACEFYQKDENLAWQVYELVASLGIKPRMRTKIIDGGVYHTVVFSTADLRVFHLSRKSDVQKKCHGHPKTKHFYIKNITQCESVPVRCIQVDNESHMFLCGKSMIPTHNTTTAAGYLLWYAIFHSDATIMIASKDQSGADEVMERLWFAYEELPWWLKPGVIKNDVQTKKLDNQTRIRAVATTKTSGRGKSNTVVYLDEFAFVPPGIASDFWTALYPTLSTGGKLIITSTPNSDEDKFASIWFNAQLHETSDVWRDRLNEQIEKMTGDEPEEIETIFENEDAKRLSGILDLEERNSSDNADTFTGFHAHWTSIPLEYDKEGNITKYRGEEFKKQTLAAGLTVNEWFREYECSFISGDETLIASEKLAGLRLHVQPPRFVDKWGCRWYEEIRPNVAYAVSLDPSDGVDQDNACIQVWEIPRMVQVAEWHSNKVGQDEQTRMLRRVLQRLYHLQQDLPEHDGSVNIYYSVERNGLGVGILRTIEEQDERSFPGWLIDSSMISMNNLGDGMSTRVNPYRGMVTTSGTKRRYCLEFKSLVERNIFVPRSAFLASEMKTFIKRGNSWAAKTGAKDDIVMSCIIMCHLIDELRSQEPELDDLISPDIDDYDEDDEDHPDNQPMMPVF